MPRQVKNSCDVQVQVQHKGYWSEVLRIIIATGSTFTAMAARDVYMKIFPSDKTAVSTVVLIMVTALAMTALLSWFAFSETVSSK